MGSLPSHQGEVQVTSRVIQCVVGNAIWDCMSALRPLHHIFDLISLGQSLLATPDNKMVDWDKEVSVTKLQLQFLMKAVQAICRTGKDGYSISAIPGGEQKLVYIATDASDQLGGITVLDVRGAQYCKHETLRFPEEAYDETTPWSINLKELWTALVALDK